MCLLKKGGVSIEKKKTSGKNKRRKNATNTEKKKRGIKIMGKFVGLLGVKQSVNIISELKMGP